MESFYPTRAGLELLLLPPQPPECQDGFSSSVGLIWGGWFVICKTTVWTVQHGLYGSKRKKTKCLGSWLLWTQSNAFRIHGDFELSFGDWAHDVPEERERLLIFCAAFSPASVSVQNRVRSNTVASGDKSIWSKILTGWGFTLRSKALAWAYKGSLVRWPVFWKQREN